MDCPKCHAPSPDTQAYCAHCGASLHAPATTDAAADAPTEYAAHPRDELETGSTFAGRYQIIEELGRGGMGRVYKVLDREVRGKVALKLIRPEIAADPAAIDRFRDELKTARGLSHPNICRVFDLGRDGDRYFLTMEYVSGEDLKSMIAMSGQLGVGTALSIAKQVCDGLREAHRHGVVHRDLKPQNVQIDKGGHAKIMDFGIARSGAARGLTGAGVALGTPQYMAPEQVEAKPVDARSDLYSLGIILYEMLTGRVPFDGDTPLSVAMKQKLERPRGPRELNPAISPDLGGLVLKCLEKDPAERYQGADELHADLVKIEQGLPTAERIVPRHRPTTSREITVHFTMREILAPSLVVAVLLVASLGAWWLWPRKAVVVATDGTDNASTRTLADVTNNALSRNVPVFAIGIGASINRTALEQMAAGTGGVYYEANTSQNLATIYRQISSILYEKQYILKFDQLSKGAGAPSSVTVGVTSGALGGSASSPVVSCN
jgi:serine/threonine protein kinase